MLTRQPPIAALLALAACAATLSSPARAAELVLASAPGSSWVVQNGAERCDLQREFGEGADRVTLVMSQWAPGAGFQMALAGAPLERFRRGRPITVAFGAGEELGARPASAYSATMDGAGTAVVFSAVTLARVAPPEGEDQVEAAPQPQPAPMLPPTAIAAADRIEVSQGRHTLRLQPGSFDRALTVLDACSQQRLESWGLDVAAHRTMSRAAKAVNMADIARRVQSRYPRPAIFQSRESGVVKLRVIVEADGTASNCSMTLASTATTLGSGVCDIFDGAAQYEPALDAAGAPMRSFHTSTIVYVG